MLGVALQLVAPAHGAGQQRVEQQLTQPLRAVGARWIRVAGQTGRDLSRDVSVAVALLLLLLRLRLLGAAAGRRFGRARQQGVDGQMVPRGLGRPCRLKGESEVWARARGRCAGVRQRLHDRSVGLLCAQSAAVAADDSAIRREGEVRR